MIEKFFLKGDVLAGTVKAVVFVLLVFVVCGCQEQVQRGQLFSVDFKPDEPVRYKFISTRSISTSLKSGSKSSSQATSETLEFVMDFKVSGGDRYGISEITATCRSAKVTRKGFPGLGRGLDPVEGLAGQSYTFQLNPTGRISEYPEIESLVQKLGERAFVSSTQSGRIKGQDMITDFIAIQWYLWDAVASIEEPLKGLSVGQNWTSQQYVPLPMPLTAVKHAVRETTYTLKEITESETSPKAVITSSYGMTDLPGQEWPVPYSGSYRMRGTFGFLRNYEFTSLSGSGEQIIDLDSGTVESFQQQYKIGMKAAFMLPLGDISPRLTVSQKISAERLEL